MKKLLLIIILLPFMAWSQMSGTGTVKTLYPGDPDYELSDNVTRTVFSEWQKYLKDCNELVADTIKQSGTVKCELVPVKMNGKIVSYNTLPIDTVWDKCECEKYKYENGIYGESVGWINGIGITLNSSSGSLWYSEPEPAKNTFSIKQNKICMIKKRKAKFEDFFERWCVEKKLIELN